MDRNENGGALAFDFEIHPGLGRFRAVNGPTGFLPRGHWWRSSDRNRPRNHKRECFLFALRDFGSEVESHDITWMARRSRLYTDVRQKYSLRKSEKIRRLVLVLTKPIDSLVVFRSDKRCRFQIVQSLGRVQAFHRACLRHVRDILTT